MISRGHVVDADLQLALQEQEDNGSTRLRIGAILIRHGLISEATLYECLAAQLELPVWNRTNQSEILERALNSLNESYALPESLARRWEAFVSPSANDGLLLVARDPLLTELAEYLQHRSGGRRLESMLATGQDLAAALSSLYSDASRTDAALGGHRDLRQLAQDAPIVEFVASMLARGTDLGASDIHIEPGEGEFAVRYRVDGGLRQTELHPRQKFDAVSSRIKLIAGLDIAERRLPQDGRFSTRAAGIETEVRVSVIPGVHGESAVLRLLPKTAQRRFRLDALGLEDDHLLLLNRWLEQPDGIILVTGPTGSGKSTTLYAALAATDIEHTRVLTVEDPVEYQLPGITQFQVQSDIGFSFPAALRAILRHDPDTIMIGEIRDTETARIAIQASLTGHKVLSTLHTNDAASAFVRLADMGVEPFLLAASVRGVVAQRLIRRLCRHCAVPLALEEIPPLLSDAATRTGLTRSNYLGRAATGCAQCTGSGYRGRVGVHEFLPTTDALRQKLSRGDFSPHDLRACEPEGFRSLQHDALLKFWRGETSLPEVLSLPTAEMVADSPV
ncbi:MAG: Flp pilus assembly complex ATPase component TadA [Burkholderiales bacterium]|nr:Flp pilus assembly complex ATPase component TadA [Burkholderiales bacterium]MDE1925896.1 Flp pilus assembly complex ATPase component TadA [Burkholderiales bacterium]MDE2502974.1 Flp pilus assembly complex ATPase component TadA [Burkholderiales bacterium]